MFIQNVLADTANVAGPFSSEQLANILPLIIMFLGFYFLIIRPQSKRQKEHNAMINSLSKGDKVITNSGLVGTILKIDDKNSLFHIEIAENVKVRILKNAIAQPFKDENKKEEDKEESKKDNSSQEQLK